MTERLTGKIARVTSDREVIINLGSDHGVTESDHFRVMAEAIDVPDPDTGESLGQVSSVKVVVRVDEVAERFAIARTFRTRRVKVSDAQPGNENVGLALTSWRQSIQPPIPAKYETRVETLKADPRAGAPISESESVVRVGDIVELILPGEDWDPVTTTLFR